MGHPNLAELSLELLDGGCGVVLVAGPRSQRAEAALEEGIAPPRQRRARHAELTGEKIEILASEEAENRFALALGRESAAF